MTRGRCIGCFLLLWAGFDTITLVSDDAGSFCHRRPQRPSRSCRSGKAGLTTRLGVRAAGIGRSAWVVALSYGRMVGYDRLVPATGTRVRRPRGRLDRCHDGGESAAGMHVGPPSLGRQTPARADGFAGRSRAGPAAVRGCARMNLAQVAA